MRVLIDAALEKSGSRLKSTDWSCEEYPCIVVLEGRSKRYFESFSEALMERGFEHVETLQRYARRSDGSRHYVWILSYWEEGAVDDALRSRVTDRMDQLLVPLLSPEGSADGE